MANLNSVHLIGRLTRDPEIVTLNSGGVVAKFGFAVNNKKKNGDQWEDEPCFVDCEAWNRGTYALANLIGQYLRKGSQAFIEGHLKLDRWTAQDGSKRQKLKIVVDGVQFLDPKQDGNGDVPF